MAGTSEEVEIKIAIPDAAAARGVVEAAGLRVCHERTFESNVVFDSPGRRLRQSGCLIRVREFGAKSSLTYKGPAKAGRHKSREELEIGVSDAATLRLMLERLGYEAAFRYEKWRTEFTDGVGMVTLDETPIGDFLELEGTPGWIDETAGRLGFGVADYVTGSYAALYGKYCEERGVTPGEMVFGRGGEHRTPYGKSP